MVGLLAGDADGEGEGVGCAEGVGEGLGEGGGAPQEGNLKAPTLVLYPNSLVEE